MTSKPCGSLHVGWLEGRSKTKQVRYGDRPLDVLSTVWRKVILLSRTETARWINVFLVGSTDQDVLGWMFAHDIEKPMVAGLEIRALDLPTNFEYNSRELGSRRSHQQIGRKVSMSFAQLVLPLRLGLPFMCIGGSSFGASRNFLPFAVVVGLTVLLLPPPGAMGYDKVDKELKDSLGWSPSTFNSILQNIERSKQSLRET